MTKKSFPNEHDVIKTCACQRVRVAARAVTRAYDRALRPTGLRSTQFTILVAASVAGGIPLSRLAGILGLERTTLTRNLAAIAREGLIEVAHPDGRTRNVFLSASGRVRLDEALPLWDRAQQTMRENLGDDGWSQVGEALAKLTQSASAHWKQ
jgi:DNA-binding MarR family transcriptional regulator